MTSEYKTGHSIGRGLGDEVIYYRRPFLTRDGEPAENAGWITWADSFSGTKLRDYEVRGFTPLRKYGRLNTSLRERQLAERIEAGEQMTPRQYQAEYIWGAILRHPDGPAEFPVEQILQLGWYKNPPVKGVTFPQLRSHKVKEYRCPECRRLFPEFDGKGAAQPFGNHLRIMHGYDRSNLMTFGDRIGIDFSAIEGGGVYAEEYSFDEVADTQLEEGLACEECDERFTGQMAKARLVKHQKAKHNAFEMETVKA